MVHGNPCTLTLLGGKKMVRLSKKQLKQGLSRIHGDNLRKIYPAAICRNGLDLYKRLRRYELKSERAVEKLCSEEMNEEMTKYYEGVVKRSHKRVKEILGHGPEIMVTYDPCGYVFKIDDEIVRALDIDIEKDWGGYGLIAPEF
jgi:hypothetical protein